MRTIDPVTLAVLKGRLEQVADEMDAALYRSAFNPIIAEARDACHGLYHAKTGATLERHYVNDRSRPGELRLSVSAPLVAGWRLYVGSETGGVRALHGD